VAERVRAICDGVARAFDCRVEADIRDVFTVLENDPEGARAIREAAAEVVGEAGLVPDPRPVTGSEDFADMLRAVPGAYAWVGHGGDVPLHNPGFVLDDAVLPVGASILARLVERRLA
jgi:hippurate hydrolase